MTTVQKAKRIRRPTLRQSDLKTAYAFAEKHGLLVRSLRVDAGGGFSLDFGPQDTANDDAIDRELALLEERHGQGRA